MWLSVIYRLCSVKIETKKSRKPIDSLLLDPPSGMDKPIVEDTTDDSVSLSWEPPMGPVSGYMVKKKPKGAREWTKWVFFHRVRFASFVTYRLNLASVAKQSPSWNHHWNLCDDSEPSKWQWGRIPRCSNQRCRRGRTQRFDWSRQSGPANKWEPLLT